jgi:serine/threonine protein kinase/Flp pilus assembly protein TadD
MNKAANVKSKRIHLVCAKCGSRLSSTDGTENVCVNCLLQAALREEDASHPARPRRFDQYELITGDTGAPVELGHGAMGVTYKAFDTNLRCEVALKVIHPRYLADESSRARFLSEARAAAQLRHRNIASVFHLGSERGEYFYAMELVEGETVEERVRCKGPIDCATALDTALQITRALVATGSRQFVHRDVKPSNVMLCNEADGAIVAKLIDFGLVSPTSTPSTDTNGSPIRCSQDGLVPRQARTGFIGTPYFASPEQFAGKTADARSDIYSLGVTLWYMISGKLPFDGTREEIQQQQLSGTLPIEQLRTVPRAIVDLIKRMLDVDPAKRPQSPAALKEQLNKSIAAIDAAKQKQQKQYRRLAYSTLAAAVIIIGALGASYILQRKLVPSNTGQIVPEKSIAVLPFENLSGDPNNAYFTEGVQEEILTRLSKIADLKVISRTSTAHYASAPTDLREIASQLGVANILEGSVQRAGDSVRVNVQLINAPSDAHLWADIYDRKLTDIFAVESDIAKTIVDTLQAKLTGAEKQLIAAQPTTDTTAYELYLKGRSLWGKRGGDNIRQAIGFYEQATARDPNYALAYAGLAEAYVILPWYTAAGVREALSKGKIAALKALQLDDNLAEAHAALAYLLYDDFDMAGSISEFQRALTLNPNYATAHHWYGYGPLTALGRFDEAIAQGRRAVELDPLSPIINADFAAILIDARRYDEAIAQLRKTLEIDPTFYYAHYNLGLALQLKGEVKGAIAEYTRAQQLSDDLRVPVVLAATKAQSGDKEAAVQMLAGLEALSQHQYSHAYWRALLYLSLGNRNKAILCLEQSIADHEGLDIGTVKVDPFLDPLRGDSRFEALVQRVTGATRK